MNLAQDSRRQFVAPLNSFRGQHRFERCHPHQLPRRRITGESGGAHQRQQRCRQRIIRRHPQIAFRDRPHSAFPTQKIRQGRRRRVPLHQHRHVKPAPRRLNFTQDPQGLGKTPGFVGRLAHRRIAP